MLIDWFTVGAQALNFLILVWLLKRLLYKPILDAIDARERRIATALTQADAKKAEALGEREEFEQKNAAFERQRAALMSQATQEAKVERARLLDAARKEADELRTKRQDALRSEQQGLRDTLTQRAREEVFAIARRALVDLAATTLEQRMTEVFLQRLRELDAAGKAQLQTAFATSAALVVRTTFVVPPDNRAAIEAAVAETLGKHREVQFETAPDQVCGIELSANGHKVAWSIADYLDSLAKGVDSLLGSRSNPQSRSGSSSAQGAGEHGA